MRWRIERDAGKIGGWGGGGSERDMLKKSARVERGRLGRCRLGRMEGRERETREMQAREVGR